MRLLLVAALAACLLVGIARDAAATPVDDLLAHLDSIERLQGSFEQQQYGEDGEVLLSSSGTFRILRPGYFAWEISEPDSQLVLADPTFEAIIRYQRPLAYRLVKVPLDDHFGHDIQQMRDAVRANRPTVVYICNPNNPTGTLTPSADIDAWIEEAPETVLFAIDEAYYEYVRAPGYWSAVKWIEERPNVVVAHTFSKIYAMAKAPAAATRAVSMELRPRPYTIPMRNRT